jgi:hypothetical protein
MCLCRNCETGGSPVGQVKIFRLCSSLCFASRRRPEVKPPKDKSTTSFPVRILRYQIGRFRGTLSKSRLGVRGEEALSRLLTADELPVEVNGSYLLERAYTTRKQMKGGKRGSKDYSELVNAERGFEVAGLLRFINIIVLQYRTVEGLADAYDYFPITIRNRWAQNEFLEVSESDVKLAGVPGARMLETHTLNIGQDLRILSFACIVARELLIVEFQCAVTSQWAMTDCEQVIRLQIDKLERNQPGVAGPRDS